MGDYLEYVFVFFVVVWMGVYDLFKIPFTSVITGIILVVLLIVTILIAKFLGKKTKEK